MRFNSFEFLIFLAVVLALAPLFRGRGRHVLLLGVHALCFWRYREDLLQRLSWPGRVLLVSAVVAAIAMLGATGRPFLYFQF